VKRRKNIAVVTATNLGLDLPASLMTGGGSGGRRREREKGNNYFLKSSSHMPSLNWRVWPTRLREGVALEPDPLYGERGSGHVPRLAFNLVPRPFFATQGKWSGERPIPFSFHMPEFWLDIIHRKNGNQES